METQNVRYFLVLCDELNFTRAAQKCGIKQPTLTAAIRRMERKLGGALFLRKARPPYVQPTALALRLYPICVQMNKLMKKASDLIR